MGYYIKKSVLARSFLHKGEGHMNWRTRCTKYSPTCPLVFTSGMTYRTVLTTGRDENTSCPVGTEYTIIRSSLDLINYPYFRPLMFTLVCEYSVLLTYLSDKRVEYKAGFGTKPRSWHGCIEVARMKLDKRLKCDADSDASTSVPAAILKLIFSANKF